MAALLPVYHSIALCVSKFIISACAIGSLYMLTSIYLCIGRLSWASSCYFALLSYYCLHFRLGPRKCLGCRRHQAVPKLLSMIIISKSITENYKGNTFWQILQISIFLLDILILNYNEIVLYCEPIYRERLF